MGKHNERLKEYDIDPKDNLNWIHRYCMLGTHILTVFSFLGVSNTTKNIHVASDLSKFDMATDRHHKGREFNLGVGAMIVNASKMAYEAKGDFPDIWSYVIAAVVITAISVTTLHIAGQYVVGKTRRQPPARSIHEVELAGMGNPLVKF